MLIKLTPERARHIAQLARDAHAQLELTLHGVADDLVSGPHPTKGEWDRSGTGAFDILPPETAEVRELRYAINDLEPAGRAELFALMRIGQGELAAKDHERGLFEAASLGDETVAGILAEDIDLQSHVDKALYELGQAPPPRLAASPRPPH
jgi:hypothetical protein